MRVAGLGDETCGERFPAKDLGNEAADETAERSETGWVRKQAWQ